MVVPAEERNPDFPLTLDLRRPRAPSVSDRHVVGQLGLGGREPGL